MADGNEGKRTEIEIALEEWIVEFDECLAEADVPIQNRVFQNSALIVEHAISEVSHGSKDDFYAHSWFRPVYQAVRKWYLRRYGAAVRRSIENSLTAAHLFHGDIFKLQIPLTLRKLEEPEVSAWLIFPEELDADEDPLAWFESPPNISEFSESSRTSLISDLTNICRALRQIYTGLMTAEKPDDMSNDLADMALYHVDNSAALLADPSRRNLGLGCWSAHQALEQTLKLTCRQKLGRHTHTHDVATLHSAAVDAGAKELDAQRLALLPDGKAMIQIRAAEGKKVTLREAYDMYRSCMDLTAQCAQNMDRTLGIGGARILLKKPQYL